MGWRQLLWLPPDDLCARETQVHLLASIHPLFLPISRCFAPVLPPASAGVQGGSSCQGARRPCLERPTLLGLTDVLREAAAVLARMHFDFVLGMRRRLRVARKPGGALLPAPAGRGAAVCGLHGGAAHAGAAAGAHRPAGAAAAGVLRSDARLPGCGARAAAALAGGPSMHACVFIIPQSMRAMRHAPRSLKAENSPTAPAALAGG